MEPLRIELFSLEFWRKQAIFSFKIYFSSANNKEKSPNQFRKVKRIQRFSHLPAADFNNWLLVFCSRISFNATQFSLRFFAWILDGPPRAIPITIHRKLMFK